MEVVRSKADHSAAIYQLCHGRFENRFFSAAGDRFVVEWDDELNQTGLAIQMDHPVYSVYYNSAFELLFAGTSTGNFHVVSLATKSELRNIAVHTNGIYSFCFLEKFNLLVVAGGDGKISIWQLPDMELLRSFPLGDFKLRGMAKNQDETRIALACGDGKVRVFETLFFNEIYTLDAHAEGATSVAFHPTKPTLITGGKDAHLKVWNIEDDYKEIISIPAHYSTIYTIAFSPDTKHFVTTSRDKSFKLWDANTLDVISKIELGGTGHTHSVNSALWLYPTHFITASDDRKINLVNLGNE
jgi:WD40 repeat protein